MSKNEKIKGTIDAWESRELGQSEEHATVFNLDQDEVDDSLELQLISIRLPKGLIDDLKQIASFHRMGYQPMVRDHLCRFANSESKRILRQINESRIEMPPYDAGEEGCSQSKNIA